MSEIDLRNLNDMIAIHRDQITRTLESLPVGYSLNDAMDVFAGKKLAELELRIIELEALPKKIISADERLRALATRHDR